MIKKIKKIKLFDIFDFALIVGSFLPGIVLKIMSRNSIYIISERKDEARDNGFWLFKYIRKEYEEKQCYYVINTKSTDYSKIKDLENIIEFGSFKHHMYFWACNTHISAHVGNGLPNHRIGSNLQKMGLYPSKFIFIQHGIVKHLLPFLQSDKTNIDMITASGFSEKNFLVSELGYPEEKVIVTGLARYDGLKDSSNTENKKTILIMPTWRIWLANVQGSDLNHLKKRFVQEEYYKSYQNLLNDEVLNQLANHHNYHIKFFVHSDMQIFSDLFKVNENVIIATKETDDVQDLINKSSILITDYSSISYDFSYLGKPVIFYKFDHERYYAEQYPLSKWDGGQDSNFGPVVYSLEELVLEMKLLFDNKMDLSKYSEFTEQFFTFRDQKNSERIAKEVFKDV